MIYLFVPMPIFKDKFGASKKKSYKFNLQGYFYTCEMQCTDYKTAQGGIYGINGD